MDSGNIVTILRKEKLYKGHTVTNQVETESSRILQDDRLDGSLKGRAGCKDPGRLTELNANEA